MEISAIDANILQKIRILVKTFEERKEFVQELIKGNYKWKFNDADISTEIDSSELPLEEPFRICYKLYLFPIVKEISNEFIDLEIAKRITWNNYREDKATISFYNLKEMSEDEFVLWAKLNI